MTGALFFIAAWGALILAWALCKMAASTDPERAPSRDGSLPADPGVAVLPPAPGEAARDTAAAEDRR